MIGASHEHLRRDHVTSVSVAIEDDERRGLIVCKGDARAVLIHLGPTIATPTAEHAHNCFRENDILAIFRTHFFGTLE